MPEDPDKSLGQLALDLLLYAPAGLVVQVVEELPELAAKGRQRIGHQVGNARVIGQFAVTMGQRQLKERLRPKAPPTTDRVAEAHAARARAARQPDAPAPETTHPRPPAATGRPGSRADAPSRQPPPPDPAGEPAWSMPAEAPSKVPPASATTNGSATDPSATDPSAAAAPVTPPARAGELRDTVDAALSGYDTLSASQVVRRLDGLGRRELEAVARHESTNRRRRTILFRTQQLLDEPTAGSAAESTAGQSSSEPD